MIENLIPDILDELDETVEHGTKGCNKFTHSHSDVSVAITVTPYVTIGKVTCKCTDRPRIANGEFPPKGKAHGSCTYTVTQHLCVEVPVEFGASVKTGEVYVECHGASADDKCDCDK